MKRWYWGVWILLVIGSFGVLEGYALYTQSWTLSATIWDAQIAFPLLAALWGLFVGGLTVHFFWTNQGPKNDTPVVPIKKPVSKPSGNRS